MRYVWACEESMLTIQGEDMHQVREGRMQRCQLHVRTWREGAATAVESEVREGSQAVRKAVVHGMQQHGAHVQEVPALERTVTRLEDDSLPSFHAD